MKRVPWVVRNILRIFVIGLSGFGFITLVMFLVLKVDLTVPGQGVVRCADWIDVTSEIKGVIRQVHVVEGQLVEQGDLLFQIEPRELELDVEETKLKIEELQSEIEKKRRQLAAIKLNIDAEIEEALALEAQKRSKIQIMLRGAKEEEIRLADSNVEKAKEYLNKAILDLKTKKKSLALKIVPQQEVDEAQYREKLAEVEVTIAEEELALLRNKFDALEIEVAEAELKAVEARKKRALARQSETLMQQDELDQLLCILEKQNKRLKVFQKRLDLAQVRAPMAGTVLTHEPEHLAGKDVDAGTTVIRLGECSTFNIECKVLEKDIPLVEEGLKARVHIVPFPKGEYKVFTAEVITVGSDAQVTEVTTTGASGEYGQGIQAMGVFPVLLKLDAPYSMHLFGETYTVKPGFSTEVEIITTKERLATSLVRRILRIGGSITPDNLHL